MYYGRMNDMNIKCVLLNFLTSIIVVSVQVNNPKGGVVQEMKDKRKPERKTYTQRMSESSTSAVRAGRFLQ